LTDAIAAGAAAVPNAMAPARLAMASIAKPASDSRIALSQRVRFGLGLTYIR